jgi:hypothetical protein
MAFRFGPGCGNLNPLPANLIEYGLKIIRGP